MSPVTPRIRFFTTPDGYRLTTRVWEVDAPAANVVCLHGIVSHGGWYLASCAYLARRGLTVHLPDRRGSGLNQEARGDVDRWETWMDDVEAYLAHLPRDRPRILLGISWGGVLAAAVALRRPDLLAGVGLIGPGIYSRQEANALQRAALGWAGRMGLESRRVAIPLRDPALFTDNPKTQAYIADDPFNLWKITIRFARANLRLLEYVTERPEEVQVPTLLLLGGSDRIVINWRMREYAGRIRRAPATVIEYPGAGHTLEFEADPSGYFEDLAVWCHSLAVERSGTGFSW